MAFNLSEAAGLGRIVSKLDTGDVRQIPLVDIDPNDKNFFEVDDVQDLMESIEVHGVLQPLVVVQHGQGYRLLASMAGIPLRDIKGRTFTDDQCNAAAEAFRQFANLQFEFVPSSSMSVRDIQSTALSRRHEIVFVDYLQIIQERGRDRYEIVTNISQGLHRMSQDHGIVVIALAQLTRPQDANGKRQRPTMASFRESGQIEQDADVAMLLFIPTPRAQNIKTSEKAKRESKSSPGLADYIQMFPTPTTGAGLCGGTGNFQQLKKLEKAGQITEEDRRNMSQGNGGQLNPTWVEWLMGFPLGWTDLNASETP